MATMREIVRQLESDKWEVIDLFSDESSTVLKTTWSLDRGRAQVAWAVINETFHQVLSPFAKVGDVSGERALNMNKTLLGVTIALEHFCLVAVGVNKNFAMEEFKSLEFLVTTFADKIEEDSGGGDAL